MVTDTRAHADAERCQRQPIAKHGDLLDKVRLVAQHEVLLFGERYGKQES
jgi:hypothetical protein